MGLTLFTSIPANIVRVDRAGRSVGPAYLERCIASWVAAGHRLVSINGRDEAAQIVGRYPAIEIRAIDRTAREATGRPLVYVADILRECAGAPDALVGLINADLVLHAAAILDRMADAADDRTLFYGQRLDVDDLDAPGGDLPYVSGFDCFFFAPAMVRELPDEGLLLGETWWDFWLPIVLAKRGCRLMPIAAPLVRHLRHDESSIAMRSPTYLDFFQTFARSLSVRLPLPGDEPWSRQVRPLLAAFLRHYRRTAGPVEQIYLSQYLSLALSLYLAQEGELSASFGKAWRGLLDQTPDSDGRRFAASLLDTAITLGGATDLRVC
jgi:hypothetical protein